MIKLAKLMFAFSLLLAVTACNPDDEENSNEGLTGDWSAITFTADVTSMTSANGEDITIGSAVVGSNLSYDLSFDGSSFTTSGSYDVETTLTVDGTTNQSSNNSYTNVQGSGSYSNTDTEITINGAFFEFEFNGVDISDISGTQTADYVINGDVLTITQNETMTTSAGGTTATTTISSVSTWERQ